MKKSDLYKRNVESIQCMQSEIDEIIKCQQEIHNLTKKENADGYEIVKRFNKEKEPFYEKRNELMRKITKPWSSILQYLPYLYDVDERDSCLEYLRDLTVEDYETPDPNSYGFTIYFMFNENPYFHNELLAKRCTVTDEGVQTSISSQIDWKINEEPSTSRKRRRSIDNRFLDWFLDNSSGLSHRVSALIRDKIFQNPQAFEREAIENVKRSLAEMIENRDPREVIELSSDEEMDIYENGQSDEEGGGSKVSDEDGSEVLDEGGSQISDEDGSQVSDEDGSQVSDEDGSEFSEEDGSEAQSTGSEDGSDSDDSQDSGNSDGSEVIAVGSDGENLFHFNQNRF